MEHLQTNSGSVSDINAIVSSFGKGAALRDESPPEHMNNLPPRGTIQIVLSNSAIR